MKKHHLHFTPTRTVPIHALPQFPQQSPPRVHTSFHYNSLKKRKPLPPKKKKKRNGEIEFKTHFCFVSKTSSVLSLPLRRTLLSLMAQNLTSRARAVCSVLVVVMFLTANLVPVTEAIWLTIPTSGTKCVSEEIQNHVVVLADYYVVVDEAPQQYRTPTISVKVCVSVYRFGVVKIILVFSVLKTKKKKKSLQFLT